MMITDAPTSLLDEDEHLSEQQTVHYDSVQKFKKKKSGRFF